MGGETGFLKVRMTDRRFLEGLQFLHGDEPDPGFMADRHVACAEVPVVTQHLIRAAHLRGQCLELLDRRATCSLSFAAWVTSATTTSMDSVSTTA